MPATVARADIQRRAALELPTTARIERGFTVERIRLCVRQRKHRNQHRAQREMTERCTIATLRLQPGQPIGKIESAVDCGPAHAERTCQRTVRPVSYTHLRAHETG